MEPDFYLSFKRISELSYFCLFSKSFIRIVVSPEMQDANFDWEAATRLFGELSSEAFHFRSDFFHTWVDETMSLHVTTLTTELIIKLVFFTGNISVCLWKSGISGWKMMSQDLVSISPTITNQRGGYCSQFRSYGRLSWAAFGTRLWRVRNAKCSISKDGIHADFDAICDTWDFWYFLHWIIFTDKKDLVHLQTWWYFCWVVWNQEVRENRIDPALVGICGGTLHKLNPIAQYL